MIGHAPANRRANAFAQALDALEARPDALGPDAPGPVESRPVEPGPVETGPDAPGPDAPGQAAPAASGTSRYQADPAAPEPSSGHAATPAADPGAGPAAAPGAPAVDRRLGRLLSLAGALSDLPRPGLDPEVKADQRGRLIAAMEAALADGHPETAELAAGDLSDTGDGTRSRRVPEQRDPSPDRGTAPLGGPRRRTRWSRRLAAGGITVGVAAGAFSGVAAASTTALPGDTLYGLKRGMENLCLGLAGSDSDRGRLLLDMAVTRMREAQRLMGRRRTGSLDPAALNEVRRALLGMHTEASQGHRLLTTAYRQDGSLAAIETLDSFSLRHRRSWAALRHRLPSQLAALGAQVSSVFDAIEREVAPLKSLLPRHLETPATGAGAPHGTGTTGAPASGSATGAAPSASGAHGSHGTGPFGSTSSGQGLVGGAGLLPPPLLGGPPVSGSPSSTGTASGGTAADGGSGVNLPPLLPGLLPNLGVGGDTDH